MNGNSLYGQGQGRDRFTYQLAMALAGRDGNPGDIVPMDTDSVTFSSPQAPAEKSFQRHLAEALAGRDGMPADLK